MTTPRKRGAAFVALLIALFCAGLFSSSLILGDSTPPVLASNDPAQLNNPGPLTRIQAPQAWAAVTCTAVVAYDDSGVAAIPDLSGQVTAPWNFVTSNTDVTDTLGHGTELASIGSATLNNGLGVAGVCGAGKIMPLKVIGSAGSADPGAVAAANNYAASHGASAVNMSLAVKVSNAGVNTSISGLIAANVVPIIAAGNDGSNSSSANALASDNPNAIRVAGCDTDGSLDASSNYGLALADICAPYGVMADSPDGSWQGQDGTSMSAATVSGAAAVLLSFNPSLSVAQVKADLMQGGTPVAALQGKVVCGCLLNVYGALLQAGYKPPVATTSTASSTTSTMTTVASTSTTTTTSANTTTSSFTSSTTTTPVTTTTSPTTTVPVGHTTTSTAKQPKTAEFLLRVHGKGTVTRQVMNSVKSPLLRSSGSLLLTSYQIGLSIQLTAHPAKGFGVTWSGPCSGHKLTCKIRINKTKIVLATFDRLKK